MTVSRATRASPVSRYLKPTAARLSTMASTTPQSVNVRNTDVRAGPGVDLTSQQNLIVGSVLDDATFADPLTISTGFRKYAAQWYGLPALFHPINIQSHLVTSAGNPIELQLSNKYTVKGIKKEQTINSIVKIFLGADGKIEKLEDRWNDSLPDGPVSQAFRKLNAMTVPTFVKVPETEEEDMKMKAERDAA